MNLQTRLQFGDNNTGIYHGTYLVVRCNFGVKREYDSYTPNTSIHSRDIEVTIIAPDNEEIGIYAWYMKNEKRSGCLTFDIPDLKHPGDTITRTLQFEEAQCCSVKEKYNIRNKKRRQLTITFTALRIKVEDTVFCTDAANNPKENGYPDDDVDMDKYNAQYDF